MDKAPSEWFKKVRDVNASANGPLLAEKARYFAKQLDYGNVQANSGFLDRFKWWQGIRSQVICGKEKSVDPNILVSLRKVCVVIYNYIFFRCTLETKKYVKVRHVNASMNGRLLVEKARYFAKQLDYENVQANSGFLDRFKGRQGKKPGYLWGRKECWPKYNSESEKSMCGYI